MFLTYFKAITTKAIDIRGAYQETIKSKSQFSKPKVTHLKNFPINVPFETLIKDKTPPSIAPTFGKDTSATLISCAIG